MMQPQVSANTAVPITSTAGILNLDHYKYLRSLLPTVQHFIESLSFTDLNNWECQIYVNLLTESDCLKWLGDFEEKTNTEWKVDKEATRISQSNKTKGCIWQMVYQCVPMDSKKDCSGKLEMRLLGDSDRQRNGKQYPCQVSINFYHNHNTTNNTVFNMESFKSQDIPSHLKEGFEGYFQETMQPVTNSGPTTINLNALKPHPPLLHSPLSSVHSPAPPSVVIKPAEAVPGSPVAVTQHMDGKLLDMAEVSHKLDNTLQVLRRMLKQSEPSVTAVRQFLDKFEKLQGDQNQLEDALTSFGGQWDWLVSGDGGAAGQVTVNQAPASCSPVQQQQLVHSPSADLSSPKSKKKIKLDEKEVSVLAGTPQSVFSTSMVGGQLVLTPQHAPAPAPAPLSHVPSPMVTHHGVDSTDSAKKRKRARCGNCSGCLNRDKTADCRQCRNCLDQKRYGGPGRLKKACVKRQCVVITQLTAGETAGVATLDAKGAAAVTAVKSDPVYGVKTEAAAAVASIAGSTATTAPTLLSWPGSQYTPTFQVQVQQPVQFAFQPSSYSGVASTSTAAAVQSIQSLQPLQYTTSTLGAV